MLLSFVIGISLSYLKIPTMGNEAQQPSVELQCKGYFVSCKKKIAFVKTREETENREVSRKERQGYAVEGDKGKKSDNRSHL